MSIPLLLGPVDTGSSFMIVSIQNNQPFFLNGSPFNGGIIYYWESNLQIALTSSTIGIFSAEGTVDALKLTDQQNSGGMSFRADDITIGNADEPLAIKFIQTAFANWFPPDVLLSRAVYTIVNGSGATARIFITPSPTGPSIPANNIIILSLLWFFNCNPQTFQELKTPTDTLGNWFCVVNSSLTGCTGGTSPLLVTRSGWTNLNDCNIGDDYTYCPAGQICGNSNCKGPCSVSYYDCDFESNNYVCVFDPNKFLPGTEWWNSPYFVGAMVAIVISIVIFVIVALIANR